MDWDYVKACHTTYSCFHPVMKTDEDSQQCLDWSEDDAVFPQVLFDTSQSPEGSRADVNLFTPPHQTEIMPCLGPGCENR